MKRGVSLFIGAVIMLSFNMNVLAGEGHSQDQNVIKAVESFREGKKTEKRNHDEHASSNQNGEASSNHSHDNGAEQGGHGHGPVTETPPNLKILGTFGGINLSFILVGIWNRRFRRKVNINGNS
ncbi:hypothetical protein [Bacillus sp. FJAT-27445]|uniref:hypothetical protein n=1 Tax=Bacillus sp. FJAT-27445 TaxID=1679166 RepID=UPI0007433E9E|nr:hypothetical protein [Bacillus sp. FJAT-27445]